MAYIYRFLVQYYRNNIKPGRKIYQDQINNEGTESNQEQILSNALEFNRTPRVFSPKGKKHVIEAGVVGHMINQDILCLRLYV